MTIRLELVDDFRIDGERRQQLHALLVSAFGDAPFAGGRTYFKQLSARRLLAYSAGALVGHLGLEHRIVGTSTGPASIFGVVDVCVAPAFRSRGLASEMLEWVERLGREHGIDFAVLFATDDRLYTSSGYRRADNTLVWLKIHEHQTIGIAEQVLPELVIKELGDRRWPTGVVDLLGHQF